MHASGSLSVLIRDGNGYDRILLVDLANTSNTTNGYSSGGAVSVLNAGAKGASPRLTPFPGGELLVWGDSMNYSPDGGKTLYAYTLQSRNSAKPSAGLDTLEYITNVVGTEGGQFAVLTSTNRVFYGQLGISTAIEINAGIPTSSGNGLAGNVAVVQLGFDPSSNLFVATPSSASPFISKRIIPIKNELASPRVPIATSGYTCSYSQWALSAFSNYTLDVGDVLHLSSSLVSSASTADKISVSITNTSVFSLLTSRSTPAENLDIIYIENSNITLSPTSSSSRGRADLLLRPNTANLGCAQPVKAVNLLADCPPSRTLVFYVPASYTAEASPTPRYHINRYSEADHTGSTATHSAVSLSTAACKDTSFTIAAGTWWNRDSQTASQSSKVVTEYCAAFGAPQQVYYGSSYRPSFAIYQDGAFVKTVEADMALLEVNGRSTYTWNTTASQAGCRTSTFSLKTGYFPASYIPCYQGVSGTLDNPTQEYQILNGTNQNSITWTGGVNGIYLFQARVLDPTYSYCNLSTNFAVQVVGAPPDIGWQLLIVGLCDAVGIAGLLLSYGWYSSSRRGMREADGKEKFE
ncbi:hypothetical protein HDU91_000985 [Kappamyces sp. JEL0680]|nr:hypothetical protein HDU91_000985 [Kappamyces sp. JEL0680]